MGHDVLCAYNGLNVIIPAFYQDIRSQGLNELQRSLFVEQNDRAHAFKGCHNYGARFLRLNGAAWPFQPFDGVVGIKGDNQLVALCSRLLNKLHMPQVQQIKTTVGENNFLAQPARYL